jgi:hypothetical protein
MSKNTICLWYDKDVEAASRFYNMLQSFLTARSVPCTMRPATIPAERRATF